MHLQRVDTNERVHVRELHGMAAVDLTAALREMSAVGEGSRSRLPLYHANIDWRHDEKMTDAQKARAIERLGEELGLANQPRVVVEHVKAGREHLHVVWSRIDGETFTAIPDSHNYRKHEIVARELEREFEHARVQGAHHEREGVERPARCPTLGETRQAERGGMTPGGSQGAASRSVAVGRQRSRVCRRAEQCRVDARPRATGAALSPSIRPARFTPSTRRLPGFPPPRCGNAWLTSTPASCQPSDQAREQLRDRQPRPEPSSAPETDREADELAPPRGDGTGPLTAGIAATRFPASNLCRTISGTAMTMAATSPMNARRMPRPAPAPTMPPSMPKWRRCAGRSPNTRPRLPA